MIGYLSYIKFYHHRLILSLGHGHPTISEHGASKIINITESFIINISNKNKISIIIPIKRSNYTYKTTFNTINDVYNYIKLHCGEIVDR